MQSVAFNNNNNNNNMSHSRPHFPQFIARQTPMASPGFILNFSGNHNTLHGDVASFVTTNLAALSSQDSSSTLSSPSSLSLSSSSLLLPPSSASAMEPSNYFHLTAPLSSLYSKPQSQSNNMATISLTLPSNNNPQSPSDYGSPMSSPDSPSSPQLQQQQQHQLNHEDFEQPSISSHHNQYKARKGKPLAQFVTPLSVEPKLAHLTRQKLKNNYLSAIPESLIVQSSCNQHSYKVESRRTFHTDPGYLLELTDQIYDDHVEENHQQDDPVICDSSLAEGYLSDGGSSISSSSSSMDLRSPSPSSFSDDDSDMFMDKLYHLDHFIGSV
jgi:hypothetical protein